MNPLTILKAFDLKSWAIFGLLILCGLLFAHGQGYRADAHKARADLATLKAAYSAAEAEGKGLALAAQENASKARAAASVTRRKQATTSKEELDEAKSAAPSWSDTPIPDGVRNALRSARARAAQQPARVDNGGLPDY